MRRETPDAAAAAFLARLFPRRVTSFADFFAGVTARLPGAFAVDFLRVLFLTAINVHVPPSAVVRDQRHLASFPYLTAKQTYPITYFH